MEEASAMEKSAVKEVCTCKDEYKVRLCPIHFEEKTKDYKNAEREATIITDANIVSPLMPWPPATVFWCPRCKTHSIRHHFNYCPECGLYVKIQSKTVTDNINKINKK